jgi:aminopeptidase N
MNEQTDTLVFNFNPILTIDSVRVGTQRADFLFRSDLLVVQGDKPWLVDSEFDVTVYYKGNVKTGNFFSSVTNERNTYWNIPVTWTLSEPFGAKHWFPCKQQLTDKADSCWVFLTIPKGRKAGSIGILKDTLKIGEKRMQYQWKSSYPIAFYLISFSVADYFDYSFYSKTESRSDSLLIQNYVYNRPGYLDSNKEDINKTSDFLNIFNKLFGLYPFYNEKYGHCVAPMGGGMEHQTMTTLANFSYTLVAHELAHQWFGNSTTCATWQDIWINEGFASYGEYLAYEFLSSKVEAGAWMNSAQNRALREPEGSVFVPSELAADEYRIFSTNLSYKKGAVIVHILRKHINNDTLFFKTLRAFLEKYRNSTATAEDFREVAEQETGLNLERFFEQWYYGKGYPMFDISWKQSNDTLLLNVNQTPSSRSMSFFQTPFEIKAVGTNFDTLIRLEQTANPQLFKIKLSKQVNYIDFDPDKWLLKVVQNVTKLPEIPSDDSYFEVNPNPFNHELILKFKTESDKNEKVSIVNLNGSILFETYARKKKEAVINTSEIGTGTYLLIVSHGQERYIRKITKANTY